MTLLYICAFYLTQSFLEVLPCHILLKTNFGASEDFVISWALQKTLEPHLLWRKQILLIHILFSMS